MGVFLARAFGGMHIAGDRQHHRSTGAAELDNNAFSL